MYLILEFVSNGELYKSIARNGGCVSEQVCLQYMKEIASAVKYMHSNFVIHRDLKPENMLIGDGGQIKVNVVVEFCHVEGPQTFVTPIRNCWSG